MILIADSGNTKTDWCCIDGLEAVNSFSTTGLNALTVPEDEVLTLFESEVAEETEGMEIDRIYFYGAGCIDEPVKRKVEEALIKVFPKANVTVESDLLGAARSLCGDKPGIACIMGTGSNSCLYDGNEIVDNVPSLGYILGDEGSGAVLGRMLISDVLKGVLPESLMQKFQERYNLDAVTVVHRVYNEPNASRFLASVTPFLLENIEEPAIHRLVLNSFKSFFTRNILRYANYKNMNINVTGSIGWYFKDVLREAADAMDCSLGAISRSPMESLVDYHLRKG
ncbi:MAG: ATPase [Muribaculaceae bacterium]|nr:ATPase [Muribaculaceae bacterium]